jgi:hypothetical protein
VIQAALGPLWACAVVLNGAAEEVRCWGGNPLGSLGNGNAINQPRPAKVPGLTAPTKVVAFGEGSSCAIDAGNVRCWGNNEFGTIGNGTTGPIAYVPTLVTQAGTATPLQNIVDLHGGVLASVLSNYDAHEDVCALDSSRQVWCWGRDFGTQATRYSAPDEPVIYLANPSQKIVRYVAGDGRYVAGTQIRALNCGALP